MTDYNAQEMARLQKEARERVVEMKNRSRVYADEMNRTFTPPNKESPRREEKNAAENTREEAARGPAQTAAAKENKAKEEEAESFFLICLFLLLCEEEGDPLLPLLILSLI